MRMPPSSSGETAVIGEADVIVVGLGAATAYFLSKRKGLSVVLLDKHEIGSQTSPRAAGMVSCVRKGDLMISLIKDACRKIAAFTEETGQPLDWVHSGQPEDRASTTGRRGHQGRL
jgi:glycine/D-amino acid oxidase-like deaminating enzyme